jgi:hypothetical protein
VDDNILREHLRKLIAGKEAHIDWDSALKNIAEKLRGKTPEGSPHSLWEILEHARIAQWDILEFSRDAKHVSPDWPSGYWPKIGAPPNAAAWDKSVSQFHSDREEMMKLVMDPKTDLSKPIPHGSGQTILRQALLVADHNSYHLGQFVLLRRLLNTWQER